MTLKTGETVTPTEPGANPSGDVDGRVGIRIQDALPGEVLRGDNGEIWVRTNRGAACVFNPKDPYDMDASPGGRLDVAGVFDLDARKCAGPFTRLVPETGR